MAPHPDRRGCIGRRGFTSVRGGPSALVGVSLYWLGDIAGLWAALQVFHLALSIPALIVARLGSRLIVILLEPRQRPSLGAACWKCSASSVVVLDESSNSGAVCVVPRAWKGGRPCRGSVDFSDRGSGRRSVLPDERLTR